MKIFFLIADLGAGGQERQLTYLLEGLQKKGHQLRVITWNESANTFYSDTVRSYGITVEEIHGRSTSGKLSTLRKMILQEKPDVLQSFSFYLNVFAWLACFLTRTKAWGAIRSSIVLYRSLTPPVIFFFSSIFPRRFVSNNHNFSANMKGWRKKLLEKNTRVISNSISAETFLHSGIRKNSGSDRIQMVSVGRISSEKRVDLLLRAHQQLRSKGYNVIHSHAGDGPDMESIRQLASDLGVKETFIFLGIFSRVADLLETADIFVHSSDFEGSPNAVMEAVAMGVPVISTNCGDVPYIVDEGKGGYVVETGNWEAIAEKAEYLINNPDLRIEMSAHNIRISRERFSIEKQVEKYLEAYSSAN